MTKKVFTTLVGIAALSLTLAAGCQREKTIAETAQPSTTAPMATAPSEPTTPVPTPTMAQAPSAGTVDQPDAPASNVAPEDDIR